MKANKAKRAGQFIKPNAPPDISLLEAIVHAKVQSHWTGQPISDFNHPFLRPTGDINQPIISNPMHHTLSSDDMEEEGEAASGPEEAKGGKGIVLPPPSSLLSQGLPKLPLPPLPPSLPKDNCDVYIFWDLEDKHPSLIDPRVLAYRLKTIASSYGRLRGAYVYITRKASNWVPDILFEMVEEIKKGAGGSLRKMDVKGASSSNSQATMVGSLASQWNRKLSESLRNSPNKSVGRISSYHNSTGRSSALKPGHQLSIRFVLRCEGMDVRLAQNALEDSGLAMAAGLTRLSAQIAKHSAAREGEGEGERSVVIVVVSDDVRLMRQFERMGKDGGLAFVLISSDKGGSRPSSLASSADLVLDWDKVNNGHYILTNT